MKTLKFLSLTLPITLSLSCSESEQVLFNKNEIINTLRQATTVQELQSRASSAIREIRNSKAQKEIEQLQRIQQTRMFEENLKLLCALRVELPSLLKARGTEIIAEQQRKQQRELSEIAGDEAEQSTVPQAYAAFTPAVPAAFAEESAAPVVAAPVVITAPAAQQAAAAASEQPFADQYQEMPAVSPEIEAFDASDLAPHALKFQPNKLETIPGLKEFIIEKRGAGWTCSRIANAWNHPRQVNPKHTVSVDFVQRACRGKLADQIHAEQVTAYASMISAPVVRPHVVQRAYGDASFELQGIQSATVNLDSSEQPEELVDSVEDTLSKNIGLKDFILKNRNKWPFQQIADLWHQIHPKGQKIGRNFVRNVCYKYAPVATPVEPPVEDADVQMQEAQSAAAAAITITKYTPNKLKVIPGLKAFIIKGMKNNLSRTEVFNQWIEKCTKENKPEYVVTYNFICNAYKKFAEEISGEQNERAAAAVLQELRSENSNDSEGMESDEEDEEVISVPTPRNDYKFLSPRLAQRSSQVIEPEASQAPAAANRWNPAVHTTCQNETCLLCQCTKEEIVQMPYGGVQNVIKKILSCPEINKHTLDDMPFATYLLVNAKHNAHWATILNELVTKFGIDIFHRVYGEKQHTTMHWLMVSTKCGGFINNVLKNLNPNSQDTDELTPITYALQYLIDNETDIHNIKIIGDHIYITLSYNQKLENIDELIAGCDALLNQLSKNKQDIIRHSITEGLKKRQEIRRARVLPEEDVAMLEVE